MRYSSVEVPCARCGAPVIREPNELRRRPNTYCSNACYSAAVGDKPDPARFWSKVEKSDDPAACWMWTGARYPSGYGYFKRQSGEKITASRFAYELAHGPVPRNRSVCHACDNPRCVRIDHLFVGTQRENSHDMLRKGRCAVTRLDDATVAEIRAAYQAGGVSQRALARHFHTCQTNVSAIVRGLTRVVEQNA